MRPNILPPCNAWRNNSEASIGDTNIRAFSSISKAAKFQRLLSQKHTGSTPAGSSVPSSTNSDDLHDGMLVARMGTGVPPGPARFSLCSMTLTYEATRCQVIGNSGYISVLFTRKITRQGLQLDHYFLAADRCCCKMMAKGCAGMRRRASGFACSRQMCAAIECANES